MGLDIRLADRPDVLADRSDFGGLRADHRLGHRDVQAVTGHEHQPDLGRPAVIFGALMLVSAKMAAKGNKPDAK